MKTKHIFVAMCSAVVFAGATFTTYSAITKNKKTMSNLTKQNLEALVYSTSEGLPENKRVPDYNPELAGGVMCCVFAPGYCSLLDCSLYDTIKHR